MKEDAQLLAEYVQTRSEAAFTELVKRHLGLVHSTAVRCLSGNTSLADDVAQTVFVDLARKARRISSGIVLSGWLYRHTCYTCSKFRRAEMRRAVRENEAHKMTNEPTQSKWQELSVVLDEAMHGLSTKDRDAVLLRYFQDRDFHFIGCAIGTTEEGARKRVSRALEHLQLLLSRRGVAINAAALSTSLQANACVAAPTQLVVSATSAACASVSVGGTGATVLNLVFTKAAVAVASVVLVLFARREFLHQQKTLAELHEENRLLNKNIRLQRVEVARAAQATETELPREQYLELMRLRGEVGVLRGLSNELRAQGIVSATTRSAAVTNDALFTRQFTVPAREFLTAIKSVAANDAVEETPNTQTTVRDYFSRGGVQFDTVPQTGDSPQKAVFFNDRTGVLFARATISDLEVMEDLLHALNLKTSPRPNSGTSETSMVDPLPAE